jgi:3-dehydroquinate synthase
MHEPLELDFSVKYKHRIYFTEGAFDAGNPILAKLLQSNKVLVAVDVGLITARPTLLTDIGAYALAHKLSLTRPPFILTGGEACKSDDKVVQQILAAIESDKICRHSYILAIGGGAFLDAVGFAAAIAHRGVRLIRMPTTTLSQADAGVGVKNGINTFGKKNFTGTFAPPVAVINDFNFLLSLDARGRRDGLVEAVKVSILKEADFFLRIEALAGTLMQADKNILGEVVRRSAELHARHIAQGGDPFELGSARPLDLGHWAAHKLEVLTKHRLSHGEAVAIGLALDIICAREMGLFPAALTERVLVLLEKLGFQLYAPEMHLENGRLLMEGLEEFREHLGGQLTLVLPVKLGESTQVHELDVAVIRRAVDELKARASQ